MTVSSSSEWGLVGGTARIQAARFACGGEQRIAVTQLLEGEGVGFVVDKVEMPAVHVINHASRWMTVSAVGTSKGSRLRAPAAAGWPERQALAYRRLALDGRLRSGQQKDGSRACGPSSLSAREGQASRSRGARAKAS